MDRDNDGQVYNRFLHVALLSPAGAQVFLQFVLGNFHLVTIDIMDNGSYVTFHFLEQFTSYNIGLRMLQDVRPLFDTYSVTFNMRTFDTVIRYRRGIGHRQVRGMRRRTVQPGNVPVSVPADPDAGVRDGPVAKFRGTRAGRKSSAAAAIAPAERRRDNPPPPPPPIFRHWNYAVQQPNVDYDSGFTSDEDQDYRANK